MAIDLILLGPIDIPFQNQSSGCAKHIDKAEKKRFLENLDELNLSTKQGCYVFALRAAKGYRPWYVGKATKSMRQECMAKDSVAHYNAVLFKGRKGNPVMYFVAPKGVKNKVPMNVCDDMETLLIQSAYYKNPELRNIQKTKVPEWSIKGIVRTGSGKPSITQKAFIKMMGL